MIKITHEFPNYFYQNDFAHALTDYDYCLIHRYLDTPSYAEYMRNSVQEGREVYLDNGVYELGTAFDKNKYLEVIIELSPTYFMLPDVFDSSVDNIESQLNFYELWKKSNLKSLPIFIPHGKSIEDLQQSLDTFLSFIKEESLKNPQARDYLIAIPFGSTAFLNNEKICGYYNEDEIKIPYLRQAFNRKKFIFKNKNSNGFTRYHLLGCKSLSEFGDWGFIFNNEVIKSIDTSLPVAMSLEGYNFTRDSMQPVDPFIYKPSILIDKVFNSDFSNFNQESVIDNIRFFRNTIFNWEIKSKLNLFKDLKKNKLYYI